MKRKKRTIENITKPVKVNYKRKPIRRPSGVTELLDNVPPFVCIEINVQRGGRLKLSVIDKEHLCELDVKHFGIPTGLKGDARKDKYKELVGYYKTALKNCGVT